MSADAHHRTVLAAIDTHPIAAAILRVASALGEALDAPVRALHVESVGVSTVRATADRAGVELRVTSGTPVEALSRALQDADVALAVLGCRDQPAGPQPAGHVALAVIEEAAKPIVVVPPGSRPGVTGRIAKVLLPLDGSLESTAAVEPTVAVLAGSGLQVTVMHVFDPEHVPAFVDQPHHALQAWGHEFLARHANTDLDLVLRSGPPGTRVLALADDEEMDLIVLGWSQNLSPGRARMIRQLLCESHVPLLLVPTHPERHPS
jgi:nucleotide-binding universal stress UspA family protein